MRTATRTLAALLVLSTLACATTAPGPARDPAEVVASQNFDATATRYDFAQAEVDSAFKAGRINASQWDNEWTPLQFAVSSAAALVASDLATWRTRGTRPPELNAHERALAAAVAAAESYADKWKVRL